MPHRRAVLALVALASFAVWASGPPVGFRALKWGATVPAGLKKLTGPTPDGTSLFTTQPGTKLQTFLDLPVAEEAYSFTKGKFYSGSAWFDGRANFDNAKAKLIAMHGQPSFSNPKLELYKWQWAGTKIEVHLSYQAKFARTTLTYVNNAI